MARRRTRRGKHFDFGVDWVFAWVAQREHGTMGQLVVSSGLLSERPSAQDIAIATRQLVPVVYEAQAKGLISVYTTYGGEMTLALTANGHKVWSKMVSN